MANAYRPASAFTFPLGELPRVICPDICRVDAASWSHHTIVFGKCNNECINRVWTQSSRQFVWKFESGRAQRANKQGYLYVVARLILNEIKWDNQGTVSISRNVMCIHVAVQICSIFIMEWVYKCMYMCHIELRCSIHILYYNVSQPAPPCRIMSWHAISTHLIARHFLSLPWLSCWCVTQIVQICNFNHPDT